jgi:hypothetical protein
MANTLLTIGMVTRETLMVLYNQLTFTLCVNREYDDQFAKAGAKIGNVLNVRKPVRFQPTSGQGLILQDLTETTVPVVLNKQYQRSFAVTSADLALNIDDFSKRFIRPAMISMANEIDFDGLGQYINIANEVGTPGTVPNTTATYLSAGVKLDNEAAPMEDRNIVISPQMEATIINALQGLFNPQVTISEQYRKGMMTKNTLRADWYMDQNVRVQTVGPLGGTPLANAAVAQTGASIITDGWTAAAALRLKQGDVIQFANVFAVNPQNFQSTGVLKDFVVTADVSSDGSGNATIPISPAIVTSGAFQNVTAGVADNAAVTINGAANTSSPRGLYFNENAFTFATADLPLYGGLDMGERKADEQLKMSMRVIRDYDINLDRAPLRIDLLGGWATLYQELACRIAS